MKTAFAIRPRPGGEDAKGLGSDVGSAYMFCNNDLYLNINSIHNFSST